MSQRVLVLMLAAGACGASAAPAWQPVPGAPEVALDLATLHLERSRVLVWVRWWGRPAFVTEPAAGVHRTTVRTEFDCAARTFRTLDVQADDGAGRAVFMSSVPGPALPVRGDELSWTYDAVCEVARAGS